MTQVVLVTGASSGFGRMISYALARSGQTVYASMRDTAGKNAARAEELAADAAAEGIDIRALELEVQSDESSQSAIERVIAEQGRIDVVVHNAGHMVFGPTEAFLPQQLAALYDINVLGTQRVNRAALPHLRAAGQGLLIWIGSSSVAGGIPPLLGPYFAAKAGMDALAVAYARELALLGIETSIIVPGAYTKGTNHFAHSGKPADDAIAQQYDAAWPKDFTKTMLDALAATVPDDADPQAVADTIAAIVDMPFGTRPFRTVVDPADDGATVSYAVIDRIRQQFLHRIGFADLLRPNARMTS